MTFLREIGDKEIWSDGSGLEYKTVFTIVMKSGVAKVIRVFL